MFIELKENEPLEIIEVTKSIMFPIFPNPYTGEMNKQKVVGEEKLIQMKVFTDGEIAKEIEEPSQSIDEYYIGKRKYQYDVDTLKRKKIYFKNHSYVITYLVVNKFVSLGNVKGWFDVVDEVTIYLKNPKDKQALKNVKQVIRKINAHNKSIDFSSIFGILFSGGNDLEKFKTECISENVYCLKKRM